MAVIVVIVVLVIAVLIGLTFTRLPFRGPKPRLGGIDELLRAQKDAARGELGFEQVALLQMGRLADLVRKG